MSDENNKIVYAALSRMSADREVIKQAYQSWQAAFAGKALDVFEVVDHIESFLGLDTAEKKVLMMSLHSAASGGGANLKDVPGFITGEAGAAGGGDAEPAVSVKEPVVALSEIYFNKMTSGVARKSSKHKAELLEILDEEGLPGVAGSISNAIKRLDDTDINLPKGLSEDDCKALCHEVYMLVCDVVGPQDADDLSYKAVNAMLEANESSRYDPKNLI